MNPSIRFALSLQIFRVTAVLVLTISSLFVAPGGTQRREGSRAPRYAANSQTKPESILSTIHGRVVYDDTNRPVGRVRVMLRSVTSFGPEKLIGTTNERGEFRIGGVPAGRYFIGVDSSGFVSPDSFLNLDESRQTRFYVDEMREYFEEVVVDGKTNKEVLFVCLPHLHAINVELIGLKSKEGQKGNNIPLSLSFSNRAATKR